MRLEKIIKKVKQKTQPVVLAIIQCSRCIKPVQIIIYRAHPFTNDVRAKCTESKQKHASASKTAIVHTTLLAVEDLYKLQ